MLNACQKIKSCVSFLASFIKCHFSSIVNASHLCALCTKKKCGLLKVINMCAQGIWMYFNTT